MSERREGQVELRLWDVIREEDPALLPAEHVPMWTGWSSTVPRKGELVVLRKAGPRWFVEEVIWGPARDGRHTVNVLMRCCATGDRAKEVAEAMADERALREEEAAGAGLPQPPAFDHWIRVGTGHDEALLWSDLLAAQLWGAAYGRSNLPFASADGPAWPKLDAAYDAGGSTPKAANAKAQTVLKNAASEAATRAWTALKAAAEDAATRRPPAPPADIPVPGLRIGDGEQG